MNNIEFKDNDYILNTYGEYTEKIHKLPVIDIKDSFYRHPYFTLGCMGDVTLYTSTRRFEELEDIYRSARYALIQGSHNKHPGITSTGDTELTQDWLRFQFLKNAIIWYDACYDYILQIIYFTFNFNTKISSEKDYIENLRICDFSHKGKFRNALIKCAKNTYVRDLNEKLTKFWKQGTTLREWANTLKHRGAFTLDKLNSKRHSFSVVNSNYEKEFSSSYISPKIVSLEELLDELIKQDNLIVNFTNYLYDFIGFNTIKNNLPLSFKLPKKFDAKELLNE